MNSRNNSHHEIQDLEFQVGSDMSEFKEYYRTLTDLQLYLRKENKDLGTCEENHIKNDPNHLMIIKKKSKIIGHAIWHESSTEVHLPNQPRDPHDRNLLREFFHGEGYFVELHELWLKTKYRGQGIGQRFFRFFEKFIKEQGFHAIIYYTDNEAAETICRKRGYLESFLPEENWMVFYLPLTL